jgi:hypothetical protein
VMKNIKETLTVIFLFTALASLWLLAYVVYTVLRVFSTVATGWQYIRGC